MKRDLIEIDKCKAYADASIFHPQADAITRMKEQLVAACEDAEDAEKQINDLKLEVKSVSRRKGQDDEEALEILAERNKFRSVLKKIAKSAKGAQALAKEALK